MNEHQFVNWKRIERNYGTDDSPFWNYIERAVDLPEEIRDEILEHMGNGYPECDGFIASNGVAYRWID